MTGNLHFYQRILIAIAPFYGFFSCYSGAGENREITGYVLEYYGAVLRMNAFFHGKCNLGNTVGWLEAGRMQRLHWRQARCPIPANLAGFRADSQACEWPSTWGAKDSTERLVPKPPALSSA